MILHRVYKMFTRNVFEVRAAAVKLTSFGFSLATSYITIHKILSTPTTFLIHIVLYTEIFIYFWLHTYARIKHEGKLEKKKVGPFAMITSKRKAPGPYCIAINAFKGDFGSKPMKTE